MSLKVRCRKCNFVLDFDIRNPGLIVVSPCESCLMHPVELTPELRNQAGVEILNATATDLVFEDVVNDSMGTVVERMEETWKQKAGQDDGNDWRAEKVR